MRKTNKFIVFLLLAMSLSFLSGCDILNSFSNDNVEEESLVTVEIVDGEGSGEYEVDEEIQITTDINNFSYWIDENNNIVSFSKNLDYIVKKDITLTPVDNFVGIGFYIGDDDEYFKGANLINDMYYLFVDRWGDLNYSDEVSHTNTRVISGVVTHTYTLNAPVYNETIYPNIIHALPDGSLRVEQGIGAHIISGMRICLEFYLGNEIVEFEVIG